MWRDTVYLIALICIILAAITGMFLLVAYMAVKIPPTPEVEIWGNNVMSKYGKNIGISTAALFSISILGFIISH